jgi:hypothetical protein
MDRMQTVLEQWSQPLCLCGTKWVHSNITPTLVSPGSCAIPDSLTLLLKKVQAFIYASDCCLLELLD